MLESLIRLTEAHARLMFRNEATLFDAVSVVLLMEHSLMTNLFDPLPPVLQTDPQEYYAL